MESIATKNKLFLTGSTSYVGTKFIEMYGDEFDIFGVARSDSERPIDLLDFALLKKHFEDFRPDFVIHLAADIGRDTTTSNEIIQTNSTATKNLIKLAERRQTPFIFTSTEAVYGGKEDTGGYVETDEYKPRSPYGASKVASEEALKASTLPYLITRGHRHVGVSKNFHRQKWFPDTLNQIQADKPVHLDGKKLFNPVLINNVCDVIVHFIKNDADKQRIINLGVDEMITYYSFFLDLVKTLGWDEKLLFDDGFEAGWPNNASLSVAKLQKFGYPYMDHRQVLDTIKNDIDA